MGDRSKAYFQEWFSCKSRELEIFIFQGSLMLELMARAGMRISEVLNLTPMDIDEHKLILQKPKSGRRGEVVYIPSKLQRRLNDYVRDNEILQNEYVFPLSYSSAWFMVKKSGMLVGINVETQ